MKKFHANRRKDEKYKFYVVNKIKMPKYCPKFVKNGLKIVRIDNQKITPRHLIRYKLQTKKMNENFAQKNIFPLNDHASAIALEIKSTIRLAY